MSAGAEAPATQTLYPTMSKNRTNIYTVYVKKSRTIFIFFKNLLVYMDHKIFPTSNQKVK